MTPIALFGDTSPPHQAELARAIDRSGCDRAVFLGDAVDEHGYLRRRRRIARWTRDLMPLHGRLFAICGNHDFGDDGDTAAYAAALEQLGCTAEMRFRFSFSHEGFHVLGLTIPRGAHAVTADDLSWCEREFKRGPAQHTRVVAVHEPLFPVAARIGLSLDVSPSSRDAFLAYLEHWRVSALVCGHEHLYSRRTVGAGVVQIISGGGGARAEVALIGQSDASAAEPHYVVLNPSPSGPVLSARSVAGEDLDRVHLVREQ
jgi:3',5'-cyclic AMP phosphodiesterase CpdA